MTENPLAKLLSDWLPEVDTGILQHGLAEHGRDYEFIVQDVIGPRPGTYRLTFTHVVDLKYETRVRDDVWPVSWGDEFTSYAQWQAAGEPDGYVWGTNWSSAYPGFEAHAETDDARRWSERLGRAMHAMSLQTDRFWISMIFHDVRAVQLSADTGTVSQVIIPLGQGDS